MRIRYVHVLLDMVVTLDVFQEDRSLLKAQAPRNTACIYRYAHRRNHHTHTAPMHTRSVKQQGPPTDWCQSDAADASARQCQARPLRRQGKYACAYAVHVLKRMVVTLDVSQEDKSPLKDEAP